MAQLSRPFQIALVAVLLFAGVWLFALQGHSTSSSSGSSPSASTSVPAASTPASSSAATATGAANAAKPAHASHGSGSSLGGLSHAIAKAHGAAAVSQHNTQQLERKSAQASDESATGAAAATAAKPSRPATQATHHGSSATATVQHPPATTTPATTTPATTTPAATTPAVSTHAAVKPQPSKAQSGAGRTPARQVLVERALDEGKIAVVLFWNPKGTDDAIVNHELQLLEAVHHLIRPLARTPQLRSALKASGLELDKPFAAFASPASQVASYGSITRGVQVYATPTILIVNKSGQTTVLTGVQDAFSIEQAIDEARSS